MLDKTKKPDKNVIGDIVRKGVSNYFAGVKSGKRVGDTVVKRVFKGRIQNKGGQK